MSELPCLATITAVLEAPPRVQLRVDGETTAAQKKYRYLNSYLPKLGDRVIFVRNSGTYLVIGALK